jgi:hypothetical protein
MSAFSETGHFRLAGIMTGMPQTLVVFSRPVSLSRRPETTAVALPPDFYCDISGDADGDQYPADPLDMAAQTRQQRCRMHKTMNVLNYLFIELPVLNELQDRVHQGIVLLAMPE